MSCRCAAHHRLGSTLVDVSGRQVFAVAGVVPEGTPCPWDDTRWRMIAEALAAGITMDLGSGLLGKVKGRAS